MNIFTKIFVHLFGRGGLNNPRWVPAAFFRGALGLDYETARRADVARQRPNILGPRHWYIDARFLCGKCGREFIFTADEQRHWYEDRRMDLWALPHDCDTCRAAKRQLIELRKHYDAQIATTLASDQPGIKRELVQIIDALQAMEGDIPQAMKQNRATLNNQIAREK